MTIRHKAVIMDQPQGVQFLNECVEVFDGKPYHIEIRDFKRPKTAEQRAKFHILVRRMAIQAGMDADELKDWFKAMYGPARSISITSRVTTNCSSHVTDQYRTVPYSSESWSLEQCSEMIDHVYRVAAENGYDLET